MSFLKSKKAILLGLPLGLLAVGAYFGYSMMAPPATDHGVPDPKPGQHGYMLALEQRVINLAPGGPYRYLKIALTVEMRPHSASYYEMSGEAKAAEDKHSGKGYQKLTPMIYDAIQQVVAGYSASELATAEGRAELKTKLREAIGHAIGEHEVLNVYFTDLVMQ
jgi:flagellar basal body-associated protein FliL